MAATEHSQQIKQDSMDYLITALLDMLQTKNLNEISITQVVKKAGVSRMAFYRNFQTLEDILIAYYKPKIDSEFNIIINRVPQDKKLNALGQFFAEMANPMKLAAKRNYEFIIQNIFNDNITNFYDKVMNWNNFSNIQKKYWTSFMSAGVYAIWREWLNSGQNESLNDIHILISDFQVSTLKALTEQIIKK
ncbi:TetR/AcrR family transcriptional regulator [Companilactobacillus nuruki]|uniref:TetR family transcriptional regulator n=1 Tax=Companilactobacillus nuruki TaxID=1993540 RepID=A0A2N7AR36_9LACO|nr:TetR/AcrR family transcriptional regulator [Companilactobacillus nuruki]PMD67814.1 TetR family transcriptional regulator [Companilactobacillus nuruki]